MTDLYTLDGNLINGPDGTVAFAAINGNAAWLVKKLNQPDPGADLKDLAAALKQQEKLVAYYKPKYEKQKVELAKADTVRKQLDHANGDVVRLQNKIDRFAEAFRGLVPEPSQSCPCGNGRDDW